QESDRSQIYRQLLEACPSHDLIGLLVDADADAAIISSVLRTKRQIFPTRRKSLAPDEDSIASYGENIRRNIRHALAQGAKPAAEVDLDEAFALFASAYRQRGSSPKFTLDELRTIHGRLVLSGESVMIGVV